MCTPSSPDRDEVKVTAVNLLETSQALQQDTMFLVAETDQALRAVLAQAHSLANAGSTLLKTVFDAIGYVPPVFLPFAGQSDLKDTGATITDDHLYAGSYLCNVAAEAFQRANGVFAFYRQAKANAGAGNDSVQLPEPNVSDEAFLTELSARTRDVADAEQWFASLGKRLAELTVKYPERTVASGLYVEAIRGLLKGANEDLVVARGEKLKVDTDIVSELALKGPQLEESGSEGEFLNSIMTELLGELGNDGVLGLMMDTLAVDSAGSRLGFLRAAQGEVGLAKLALELLVAELADIEPIEVSPCLIGPDALTATPVKSDPKA